MVKESPHTNHATAKPSSVELSSFKRLVETSYEGVCILNDQSTIVYVNPCLCRLLELSEEKLVGRKITDFLADSQKADRFQVIHQGHLKKKIKFEEHFVTGTGNTVWMLVSIDPSAAGEGNRIDALVHFTDITDLKRRDIHAKILGEFHSRLIELTDTTEIFQLIGQTIHEIIPGRIVGIAVVDEKQEQVSVLKLLGVGSAFKELTTKFNIDLPKIKFQIKDATKYLFDLFTSEKLHIYQNDLYSLLLKRIPKKICSIAEKKLQINQITIMGFLSEGKHLGGVIICSKDDISQYSGIIESVIFQGMQVVKRIRSEMTRAISEERMHQTFDAIEDGYWDLNIATGEVVVNDRWFTMLGYQPNEFPATLASFMKLLHPDDVVKTQDSMDRVFLKKSNHYIIDFRLRMKSGEYKCIHSRGKVVGFSGSNKPIRMVGTHTDITQQKQLEFDKQLFYETQRKLMQVSTLPALYDLIGSCLVKLVDGYAVFTKFDKKANVIKTVGFYGFGRNVDDLVKKFQLRSNRFDVNLENIDPEHMTYWEKSALVQYDGGIYDLVTHKIPRRICQAIENRLSIKQIHVMGCRWSKTDYGGFVIMTRNGLGTNKELIETLINDTAIAIQRIMVDDESRITQNRYQNIFEQSPTGIVTIGFDFKFITANKEFCNFCGYSLEELQRMTFVEITHPDTIERDVENVKKLIAGEFDCYNSEKRYIRKDGQFVWAKILVNRISDAQGKFLYLLAMITDISNEKAAEEAILENRNFLEIVLNTIPNLVFVRDVDGCYRLTNKAFAEAMGTTVQGLVGKSDVEISGRYELAEEVKRQDQEVIASGNDWINPDITVSFPNDIQKEMQFVKRPLPNVKSKKPAILGVLTDISERKQIEREIRESEEKYHTLFESMRQGVFYQDASYAILDVNQAAMEMVGLSREDFIREVGTGSLEVVDENSQLIQYESLPSVTALRTGSPIHEVVVGFRNAKTGKDVWTVVSAIPQYRDFEPKPYQVFVTLHDITLQKQIEKELRVSELRYRTLIHNSPSGVYQTDAEGRNVYFNERLCSMNGLSSDEMAGDGWLNGVYLEDRENIARSWKDYVRNGGTWSFEYRLQNKTTGQIIWVYDEAVELLDDAGNRIGFIGTKINLSEQKLAEERLKRSEEKYRLLTENMHDVIWSVDTEEMQITYVSPSIEKLTGFTPDEIKVYRLEDLFPKQDPNVFLANIRQHMTEYSMDPHGVDKYFINEYQQVCKDGGTVWVEIVTNYFINPVTKHIEMKGVTRNISDRKQSEQERQSLFEIMRGLGRAQDFQEFLELIHQQLSRIIDAKNLSLIFRNNETGLLEEVYCVDEFQQPHPSSRIEKSISAFVFKTGESLILRRNKFQELAQSGQMDGMGMKAAVWMGAPLRDGDKVIGVISVQNYTDEDCYSERDKEFLTSVASQVAMAINHRRSESALQKSEEKHRQLIENSHDIIYTLNLAGDFTFVSKAWTNFLGHETAEITGKSFHQYLYSADRRKFQAFMHDIISSKKNQTGIEYRIKHADGSWRWHSSSVMPIFDARGQCIGIEGTARDITERKQAEAALQESEERYRALVEKSPVGIMLAQKGKFIYANAAGLALLGAKSLDQIAGQKVMQFIHPNSRKQLIQRILELRRGLPNSMIEVTLMGKDGWVCDTESVSSQIKINGETAVLIFGQNITARKAAEEKIRKNTEDLTLIKRLNDSINRGDSLQQSMVILNEETKKLFPGNGAAVYLTDPDNNYLELQSFQIQAEIISWIEKQIGISIPKVRIKLTPQSTYSSILMNKKFQYFEGAKPIMELIGEFTDNPVYQKLIPMIYKRLAIFCVFDIPLIVNDKSVGILELSSNAPFTPEDLARLEFISSELGSIIRRKQAEEALKESEEKFRQIVEGSNDIFIRQSFSDLKFEYVSPKVAALLGYDQNEILSLSRQQTSDMIHPDDRGQLDHLRKRILDASRKGEKNLGLEYRLRSKKGAYRWFSVNYSLLMDQLNEPAMILGTLSDITERKVNEQTLKIRLQLMQLAPTLSINALLTTILDEVVSITDSQFGFYHFIDPDENGFSLKAWSTGIKSIIPNIGEVSLTYTGTKNDIWAECQSTRKPVVLNTHAEIVDRQGNVGVFTHVSREMIVPVIRYGKIVSVLSILNKSYDYSQDDLDLVTKLADLAWDIVENKNIEAALHESQAIFDAFMENSPIYVFFKDKEIRSKHLSRNYETLLGKPLDQLLNKNNDELFPSEMSKKMVEDDKRTLAEGETLVVDEELNGRFYTTIKFPIIKEGIPEYLAGFTIDITDRVLSEKKLAESEELYRLISSVVSDYLFSTRLTAENKLEMQWVAGAFETITGYTMPEYIQHGGWRACVYPDDLPIDDLDMQKLSENKKVITEIRTIKKDGTVIWVKVYAQPIWDEASGVLIGISGAVQDITDRKKDEAEIRKSAKEFEVLYETAKDFSLHRDSYVILQTTADRASTLFGVSRAFVFLMDPDSNELELKFSNSAYHHLGSRVKLGSGLSGIVAENKTPMIINDYKNWTGRLHQYDDVNISGIMVVPMMYGGQLIGVLGIHEENPTEVNFTEEDAHFLSLFASQAAAAIYSADLFEQLRDNAAELEKRVDDRTRELITKNKELETFTYTVSHDLKAPLRGISGYSTLLMEDHADQLDEEGKKYLANLVSSTQRMNLLIEDLLAYSRVERREIKKTNVNLDRLIDNIIMEYEPDFKTEKIQFKKEIEYGTLFTDQDALAQALRNLIDNAIKFTKGRPNPEISVQCSKLDKYCLISVEDNGIGFDMKYYEKIFEIFQRLHLSEEYPGTGVGLAVVRKAVERLGGKIWAVSEPGVGSTFFMELPL